MNIAQFQYIPPIFQSGCIIMTWFLQYRSFAASNNEKSVAKHLTLSGYWLNLQGEELYKRSAFVLIPFVLYTILYVCILQFTK